MALSIGPGLVAWIAQHQATPLSDEQYLPPDFGVSAVAIQIANAQGQPVRTLLGYDKATGTILEPGPGAVVPTSAPAVPQPGFDIGFPPSDPAALLAAAQALGATWCGMYIGGPTYAGTWTPALAQGVKSLGLAPIYVGANVINGRLEAGPLLPETGAGHGADALTQLGNFGFNPGLVFLDIEAGTYVADPTNTVYYAESWIQAVRDGGGLAGIYATKACLDAIAARVNPIDATWLANWDGTVSTEGYDLHQYRGSTVIAGLGVDLNIARADFVFQRLS